MNLKGPARLTVSQQDALAIELQQLANTEKSQLGSMDARYIQNVLLGQRLAAISGRLLLLACWFSPWFVLPGALLLALAKILDNMEIGHNVLHGQYDFMQHPTINSRNFEWDIACDAKSWQRTHNFEHHTYTNIIGQDRDFGYGLLRLSADFRWRWRNLWQFWTYLLLSSLFQWGVSYHELAAQRVFGGRKKNNRHSQVSDHALKQAFFIKGGRQLIKDYAIWPLLCWPVWGWVLIGNLAANLLRNWWTATVIFCGHFTADIVTFTPADCQNESKGQWYYRQMLGSSNFHGPRWLHILTGHLSCQIEHHLFPDIPAWRYPKMAAQVQNIAQRYGIPYHTGSFIQQYLSVLRRILRFSLPDRLI